MQKKYYIENHNNNLFFIKDNENNIIEAFDNYEIATLQLKKLENQTLTFDHLQNSNFTNNQSFIKNFNNHQHIEKYNNDLTNIVQSEINQCKGRDNFLKLDSFKNKLSEIKEVTKYISDFANDLIFQDDFVTYQNQIKSIIENIYQKIEENRHIPNNDLINQTASTIKYLEKIIAEHNHLLNDIQTSINLLISNKNESNSLVSELQNNNLLFQSEIQNIQQKNNDELKFLDKYIDDRLTKIEINQKNIEQQQPNINLLVRSEIDVLQQKYNDELKFLNKYIDDKITKIEINQKNLAPNEQNVNLLIQTELNPIKRSIDVIYNHLTTNEAKVLETKILETKILDLDNKITNLANLKNENDGLIGDQQIEQVTQEINIIKDNLLTAINLINTINSKNNNFISVDEMNKNKKAWLVEVDKEIDNKYIKVEDLDKYLAKYLSNNPILKNLEPISPQTKAIVSEDLSQPIVESLIDPLPETKKSKKEIDEPKIIEQNLNNDSYQKAFSELKEDGTLTNYINSLNQNQD